MSAAEEIAALRRKVDELREDKARLDWLDNEHTDKTQLPVMSLSVKRAYRRNSADWCNITGTARDAIDAARCAK